LNRLSYIDLDKSSYRNIWYLAWPVMLSQVLITTLNIADMFWIGKLGPVPIASIAIAGSIMWVLFAITHIFYIGNIAMVARFAGREERQRIEDTIFHSFVIAFLISIIISISGFISAPSIMKLFGADEIVRKLGVDYIRIIFLALPFLYGGFVVFSSLTALGDTKTPTKIIATACIINIILDPILIFGVWKLPAMGVKGAATATSIAHFIAFVISVVVLHRRKYIEKINRKVNWETIGNILKIGIPACLQRITRPLTGMIMFKVVALYGTTAIAAFGIGGRGLGVIFIYLMGLMTATQTLVGQSLGAKRLENAIGVVKKVLLIGFLVQIPITILFLFLAPQTISIFNTNPEVIRVGSDYLRILSLSLIFIVPTTAFGGAQTGAGDTKPPMIASVISNWVLKMPLAYIIASYFHFASRGVWLAIAVSVIVEAIIVSFFYFRGGWKKKKI
jgi:putative MATE family efflux protein